MAACRLSWGRAPTIPGSLATRRGRRQAHTPGHLEFYRVGREVNSSRYEGTDSKKPLLNSLWAGPWNVAARAAGIGTRASAGWCPGWNRRSPAPFFTSQTSVFKAIPGMTSMRHLALASFRRYRCQGVFSRRVKWPSPRLSPSLKISRRLLMWRILTRIRSSSRRIPKRMTRAILALSRFPRISRRRCDSHFGTGPGAGYQAGIHWSCSYQRGARRTTKDMDAKVRAMAPSDAPKAGNLSGSRLRNPNNATALGRKFGGEILSWVSLVIVSDLSWRTTRPDFACGPQGFPRLNW